MSVISFKCPNCDGELIFDPASGAYKCEYCGSKFTQEELDAMKPAEEQEKPASSMDGSQASENTDVTQEEKKTEEEAVIYTCPSCGETFRLNYSTLYHQMEDLVMIYLVPESEVKKTYEIFYEKNALADYRTEKYLYRIVTSANQLVEKIQIFDAGKDDRVMELVKLLVTDSLHENNPDKEFDELRFAVDDNGTNILIIINKGEITGAVDIDNMYEFASSHCTDFKDLRDDEDIVINREWILNKLAEAENE